MVATPSISEGVSRHTLQCSWPLRFFEERGYFKRDSENQPYIEWLRSAFKAVDDESGLEVNEDGEETDESEEDEIDADDTVEEVDQVNGVERQDKGDTQSVDQKYIDQLDGVFSDYFDSVKNAEEIHRRGSRGKARCEEDNASEKEVCDTRSVARIFMDGMAGNEEILPYRDQVDVVAGFFERANDKEIERHVALLHDIMSGRRSPISQEDYKPRRLALNLNELRVRLSKQRFSTETDEEGSLVIPPGQDGEAERRVLFLPDLDPFAMGVVLETAPRTHALTLKNFFHSYLTGKAAIGVAIPPRGFKVYTFNLHIPFYVLLNKKDPSSNAFLPRRGHDGKLLRRSWPLPFLSPGNGESHGPGKGQCLYEAQISLSLTGIDHRIWTAYSAFDTYYALSDNEQASHDSHGRPAPRSPLAADQLIIHNDIEDPRQYFFKLLENWMLVLTREWNAIADKVGNDIELFKQINTLPLDFDASGIRQGVREYSELSRQMVLLLRILIPRLKTTVGAWETFRGKDMGYFLFDDDSPTSSTFLKDLVKVVDTRFSGLGGILKTLEGLETELRQDSPQGLHAHYNHGNHEAQLFQQRSARHIQILTVITILYLPLALASNMFSTSPGVLPFTPNFGRFIICLVILAFLIVVSVAALFKWDFFVKLIPERIPWWPLKPSKSVDLEQGVKRD